MSPRFMGFLAKFKQLEAANIERSILIVDSIVQCGPKAMLDHHSYLNLNNRPEIN